MTLKQQAEKFMTQIKARRRNPVRLATAAAYQSHLNKWILPLLGSEDLAKIENGVVKNFIQKLTESDLKPASITAILTVVKMVVASAVDENGNQLFPRVWNHEFLDTPIISKSEQDAPILPLKALETAIKRAKGTDKALYALLAGTGLRVGEALALMVGPDDGKNSFWQPETKTLVVRTTVVKGKIQDGPKTEAGIRVVDLSEELNVFLTNNLSQTETGLLFKSEKGGIVRTNTAYEHLENVGIKEGFHAFRRFRITHLEGVNCPPGLQRFWTGHSASDTHEGYIKFGEKIQERKDWVERAGLGFRLEAV